MKTAIITSESSLSHDTGSGHPESVSRVKSIIEKLKRNKKLIWRKPSKYNTLPKCITKITICISKGATHILSNGTIFI